VPGDGHRLGEGGVFDGQTVGNGQGEGLLDNEVFGVPAGSFGGESDQVHLLATAHKRGSNDGGAGARCLASAGTVVEHFTAELAAEYDRLMRARAIGVSGLGHHVGDVVAVVAGMQVRAADAAP
jgi:hypothetical protein